MRLTRREMMGMAAAVPLSLAVRKDAAGAASASGSRKYRRIAVEEHFMIPEIAGAWRKVVESGAQDEPGFKLLAEAVYANPTPAMALINQRLADVGPGRIEYMDSLGIDMQVVAIGAPGVQILETGLAVDLAKLANDRLAQAVRTYPKRLAGLATVAPQNPAAAAQELERAVKQLGMRGAFIASHTKGEYLDLPKFWPIFEAAAALDVPIYLHPREPSPDMLKAYLDYMLFFAGWGFAAETGLHALRLIFSGVFDKFPGLKIILGHLGEGVPYWEERIDSYHLFLVEAGKQKKMARLPSEYLKDNFMITTSGMNSRIPVQHALEVMGAERIMYANDYPYTYGDTDVAAMNRMPIPDGAKQKIFHGNAERLFKLS